jgi:hypothetical protein
MGLSASKQEGGKVCLDCDRKTQKELPSDDSSSVSKGMPCEEIYARVGKSRKSQFGDGDVLGTKPKANFHSANSHAMKQLALRNPKRMIDGWKHLRVMTVLRSMLRIVRSHFHLHLPPNSQFLS